MHKVSDAATIVLVGSFNPKIFHPSWFETNGLLQAKEVEGANIDVISNDYAIFEFSWLRIEVLGDRFSARTQDESQFGPLRDLVVGTFQYLEHTPITSIGLNRDMIFDAENEDAWNQVGHTLAPKTIWNKFVDTPGMALLSIQSKRIDDRKGSLNIKIAPAVQRYSIRTDVNDHVDFDEGSRGTTASEYIQANWDASLSHAEKIITGVIQEASKT